MSLSKLLPALIIPTAIGCADLDIVECDAAESAWIDVGLKGTKEILQLKGPDGDSRVDIAMEGYWEGEVHTSADEIRQVLKDDVNEFVCGENFNNSCPEDELNEDGTCSVIVAEADLLNNNIVYDVNNGIFQAAVETHQKIAPILEESSTEDMISMCDNDVTNAYAAYLGFTANMADTTTHEGAHFAVNGHHDEVYAWGYAAGDVGYERRMEIMCRFPNVICGEDGSVDWFQYDTPQELKELLQEKGHPENFTCE